MVVSKSTKLHLDNGRNICGVKELMIVVKTNLCDTASNNEERKCIAATCKEHQKALNSRPEVSCSNFQGIIVVCM
ncbi:unnamed protein product [Prunus armeniaca]